jgi:hypothetical protein
MPKARKAKLKVFRTPIGFHDAYVAAPSQKAALEAWGAGTNLFTQGAAEQVTDPKLMKAALERPGEVVKVVRGSEGEHVAALGKATPKTGGSRIKPGMTTEKKGKKPSRTAIDRAEAALEQAERRHHNASARLKAEQEAIERRRRELERKQRGERERLSLALDDAREAYRAAMEKWAG